MAWPNSVAALGPLAVINCPSTITGSSFTRAGGGGGGAYRADPWSSSNKRLGGDGGGGNGGIRSQPYVVIQPTAATSNTGSGGGGAGSSTGMTGANGGSGVVILRWKTADATISSTRTGLTDGGVQTDGDDSYIVFTAGTGTISFS